MAAPAGPSSDALSDDPIERIGQIVAREDEEGYGEPTPPRSPKGQFTPKPPAKAKAAAPVEPAEPELTEEQLAALESEESLAEEVPEPSEEEAAAAAEAEAEAAEAEEGAEGLMTVGELAQTLDVQEDALLENVAIENAAGEQVALSDVIREYANQPAATEAAEQYDTRRQELDSHYHEREQTLDAELNRATAMVQRLITDFTQETPDWDTLKVELEPDEYLKQKEAWLTRDQQIRASLDQLGEHAEQREADQRVENAQTAKVELQKLQRVMPAWRNEEKAKTAMGEMRTYLADVRHFTPDEVNSIMDHRMVMVIWDALHGHNVKAAKPKALRRIAAAKGKVAMRKSVAVPGARQDPETAGRKRSRIARARLKKSGSLADAAAAIEEML